MNTTFTSGGYPAEFAFIQPDAKGFICPVSNYTIQFEDQESLAPVGGTGLIIGLFSH